MNFLIVSEKGTVEALPLELACWVQSRVEIPIGLSDCRTVPKADRELIPCLIAQVG
jgi:hypothetical protein